MMKNAESVKLNSQTKFKTSMLRSSLLDFSDAYVLANGSIIIAEVAAAGGNNSIEVVFKNCAPFTNCIVEINNIQIDVVMSMQNLREFSDNYSKNSGSLWQYYRDELALSDAGTLTNVTINGASFKFKQKITSSTANNGTEAVQ